MSDDSPIYSRLIIIILAYIFCTAWKYSPPEWAIEQVESWRPLVREVIQEKKRHPKLTQELVLSIIAQESMGNRYATSSDGHYSRGLGQIVCAGWMRIDCNLLFIPKVNLQWTIWFVEVALYYNDGNTVKALQQYNCGPDAREQCGKWYADLVLKYWMPNFRSWSSSYKGKRLTE